ncbi:YdcF family protein [Blautia sp. MSJ-19]|uniref:YdcF family protein n=1 Tax=Blautia sp. MSJ-19 TaxID=2841517 RepID=UPI001C0EFBF5|nr:YdcF family protein [Blautia sp. MSJ-19]MBU5480002.1 YdcF family protein [Blautia sp. MSJ-19]
MYEEFIKETGNFIFAEDRPERADIIFVPGNGYSQMAEKAAELYREGYASLVLPSGKYSISVGKFAGVLSGQKHYNGNYSTEWEFLRDVLIKNGVPEKAVLREDEATFTWENAKLSKKVTDAAGIIIRKAIICCKNYHARRALMYYQRAYPEVEFRVCPCCVDGITRENWTESEKGIKEVLAEVNRIVTQFSLMM